MENIMQNLEYTYIEKIKKYINKIHEHIKSNDEKRENIEVITQNIDSLNKQMAYLIEVIDILNNSSKNLNATLKMSQREKARLIQNLSAQRITQ